MSAAEAREACGGCGSSSSSSQRNSNSTSSGRRHRQWRSRYPDDDSKNSSSGDCGSAGDCSVHADDRSNHRRGTSSSRGNSSSGENSSSRDNSSSRGNSRTPEGTRGGGTRTTRQVTTSREYTSSNDSDSSSHEVVDDSSGERKSSGDGATTRSCGGCATCSSDAAENRRLQKVVDKPVLDGVALLSIKEFLSLSSCGSAASLSSSSFLADASPPVSLPLPYSAHPSGSSASSPSPPAVASSSIAALPSPAASPAAIAPASAAAHSAAAASLSAAAAADSVTAASLRSILAASSAAATPSCVTAAPAAAADFFSSTAPTSATAASPGGAVPFSASAAAPSVAAASPVCPFIPAAAASSYSSCSTSCSSAALEETQYVAVGAGVVRDAFLLENVFSEKECAWLWNRTEENAGYTYWDTTGTAAASYRSAFTVEMRHPLLAAVIWDRVKRHVVQTLRIDEEDEARAERDLLGEWIACGINSTLLFARYTNGGHFSPHTDGCTAVDFNTRSFWPALLYLNAVTDGGETVIIDDAQKSAPMARDAEGRHTAQPQWIVEAVKPVPGRMLFFYYTQLHESRGVGPGAVKYIIRTDVVYTRKLPLLTGPADKEAFTLWQKAQVLAEEGMTEEAVSLFRRSVKMSPALAEVYGM